MLDKSTQGVTVRRYQDGLALFQTRSNRFIPKRNDTIQCRSEGFGKLRSKVKPIVTWIVGRVVFTGCIDRRRRDIIRTSPYQYLVLSVLVDRFLLIETLQSTIMTLVEFPCVVCRKPHEIRLFQHMPQSTNSTLQQRRKGNIGLDTLGSNQLASFNNFFRSPRRQRTIIPTSKLVLQVPSGFTMSYQHQRTLFCRLLLDQATKQRASDNSCSRCYRER
mmetsp:Transcript_25048/g.42669  ORF Transcript_25048/g.42669 Transcript_25048/m.42669 type:complete len:218 (-) Transcript_25048:38-691(-)